MRPGTGWGVNATKTAQVRAWRRDHPGRSGNVRTDRQHRIEPETCEIGIRAMTQLVVENRMSPLDLPLAIAVGSAR